MHFLVYERHEAPLVSCIVHANVGAFDEEEGSTGNIMCIMTAHSACDTKLESGQVCHSLKN
jgi:predicted Zn-dependent peptidase